MIASHLLGFKRVDLVDLPTFLGLDLQWSALAGNPAPLISAFRAIGVRLEPRVYSEPEVVKLLNFIVVAPAFDFRA